MRPVGIRREQGEAGVNFVAAEQRIGAGKGEGEGFLRADVHAAGVGVCQQAEIGREVFGNFAIFFRHGCLAGKRCRNGLLFGFVHVIIAGVFNGIAIGDKVIIEEKQEGVTVVNQKNHHVKGKGCEIAARSGITYRPPHQIV